jgi:hypothetical protein
MTSVWQGDKNTSRSNLTYPGTREILDHVMGDRQEFPITRSYYRKECVASPPWKGSKNVRQDDFDVLK